MKLRVITLIAMALAAPTLTGCSQEPTTSPVVNPGTSAPALPSVETMSFDFSFFDSGAPLAARATDGSAEVAAKQNWINAVTRVIYLNLTIADIFSAPIYAIHAATSTEPVLQPDGWFVWTYAWTESPGHDLAIRLRARIDGAEVTWEMRVDDSVAGLQDFLWFSGKSMLASDTGYWIFNDNENGKAVAVARIDYADPDKGRKQLRFSAINAASEDYNDSLTYSVDGDIVAIVFHDESEQADADITWNEATGVGSLMVPDYNNGERACWDEQQQDTVCEPVS